MSKSDVYLISVKDKTTEDRTRALKKLIKALNPFSGYRKKDFIPVKLTLGDTKCVHHISPKLVKTVVSEIKNTQAKPFIFDTNVIYTGSRQNSVDHLTLAQNKGFAHSKVGAPFIIADGVFGQDGTEYEIDSEFIKKIKVPSFVGFTQNLVVLSHVTGHILSGFAAALKNVAMGMSCKPTKLCQHSSVKPHIVKEKCTSCGLCIEICPANAVSLTEENGKKVSFIDKDKCIGCGECICVCNFDAVFINWHIDTDLFAKRLIDTAAAVLSKFKNTAFINFAVDMTKECDCISHKNDKIICEDIGILASKDPLALDKATVDLINKGKNEDIILKAQGQDTHKVMFEYAQKKGIGSIEYNLIDIAD